MYTIIFVGGPRDGDKVAVEELRPVYMVDVIERERLSLYDLILGKPDAETTFKIFYYYICNINTYVKGVAIYAPKEMTVQEVRERLLANYNPPKKEE